MKILNKINWGLASVIGILLIVINFSCDSADDITITETDILTTAERENLMFLREEEKLARDVYLYASEKYGLRIFENISGSEQRHMDKVLNIMNTYGIEDNTNEQQGVFNNTELQQLYNELTAKVDLSLMDALMVGATIEDLDIKDIQEFLHLTEKDDLTRMYNLLMCGSRNHIRAYVSQIESRGGSYEAQYISHPELISILNNDNERCGRIY